MICFFAGELCVIFSGMGHLVWHLGARPSSAGKSMIWIWGFGGGVCGHDVRFWRLQLLGLCNAKAIVHKRLRLRGLCSRCAVWEATTSRIVRRQGYCSQEIEMREEC